MKYRKNCQKVTQNHAVSKHCWKNSTNRLAQHKVAANIQFVKNTLKKKYNTTKRNKTRDACTRECDGYDAAPVSLQNPVSLQRLPVLKIQTSLSGMIIFISNDASHFRQFSLNFFMTFVTIRWHLLK